MPIREQWQHMLTLKMRSDKLDKQLKCFRVKTISVWEAVMWRSFNPKAFLKGCEGNICSEALNGCTLSESLWHPSRVIKCKIDLIWWEWNENETHFMMVLLIDLCLSVNRHPEQTSRWGSMCTDSGAASWVTLRLLSYEIQVMYS